jgi:hypothetical protein
VKVSVWIEVLIITTTQKPQDGKMKEVEGKADKKDDVEDAKNVPIANDNVRESDSNEVEPKVDPNANKIEEKNAAEAKNNVIADDTQKELKEAREKLEALEKRIKELEAVAPKKYKPVKFQNYGNRKRILVNFF